MKLDFGSPKPPRREELEEQASIDFVFIPPETKERVLTEHQKEVKRTKRSVSSKFRQNKPEVIEMLIFFSPSSNKAFVWVLFERVDIPAMYNNLDSSLDTTVFTQYTQSQEESL